MGWHSLTVDVSQASAELVESALYDCGASGMEVRDGEGPLMPKVRGPAAGEVVLVAYFDDGESVREAESRILDICPTARCAREAVEEKDWSVEWRSQIRSVRVGRLWVGPPWEREQAPQDAVALTIEPKMAFGTGDHPTTSLCLKAVDDFMAQNAAASVLDVGTGTGLLALAAKKLGASRTEGTDNDPVAVELAQENAAVNGVEGVRFRCVGLEEVEGRFDLVLANILANTLVALAAPLSEKVGRRLVLAGILSHQADEVEAAYVRCGLAPAGRATDGEWVRLDLTRPAL